MICISVSKTPFLVHGHIHITAAVCCAERVIMDTVGDTRVAFSARILASSGSAADNKNVRIECVFNLHR